MAWVTWRQHRAQALTAALVLLSLAVAALVTSLPIRDAFHRQALTACLPPSTRPGCDIIVRHFHTAYLTRIDAVRGAMILPVLVGLFVGAPLLARELETGTYRLAWTQGISRSRWLLWKTLFLVAGTIAAAALLAGLTMWWRAPFDAIDGRISPASFDIEGIVVPAYAVFALAVGTLAGLLLRRTVAAMTLTLAVYVTVRLVVARLVRPHFLAPLQQVAGTASTAHSRDWVLNAPLVDAAGRSVPAPREDLAILHARHGGLDPQEYLASLGWHRIVSLQPAGRFWTFQLLEAGIFVALTALAIAATLVAVRRIPS